jgi:hypothetical protein
VQQACQATYPARPRGVKTSWSLALDLQLPSTVQLIPAALKVLVHVVHWRGSSYSGAWLIMYRSIRQQHLDSNDYVNDKACRRVTCAPPVLYSIYGLRDFPVVGGWGGDTCRSAMQSIMKIREYWGCGEPAISLHSHHVSLVQWTTRLLPVTRDPGSNPRGVLVWNRFSC